MCIWAAEYVRRADRTLTLSAADTEEAATCKNMILACHEQDKQVAN